MIMPPHPPVVPESPLLLAGDIILYASIPAILGFSLFYFFRSNWKATKPGEAILWLSNSLCVVLLLSAFTRFVGNEWPGREYVRIVIYLAVTFAVWRLFITLLLIQRKERKS